MSQLQAGQIFADRFVIEHLAGVGGMGAVYRAQDRSSGISVALKILHREVTEAEEAGRFVREARILGELRHPGITRYVAHGILSTGQAYLAMEWLEGETLATRLARSGLALSESLRCARAIAAALSEAHGQGIIHRDLKPANLYLREGSIERVVMLDFGIARHIGLSQAMTQTGMVVGTPEYMAPEQAQGRRALTPAVDVFSLGTILFECLIGEPPFVAEHVAAVLANILFGQVPELRKLRPELPSAVTNLVASMLAREVDERLPDARAVLHRIDEVLSLPLVELSAPRKPLEAQKKSQLSDEQGLVTVMLCTSQLELGSQQTQRAPEPGGMQAAPLELVLRRLGEQGANFSPLGDGSLILSFAGLRGTATDQVAQAVRCGLVIREHWPEATVSVATGRGALTGRIPTGEALDRAVAMLKSEAKAQASGGLLLDEVSAGLLDARFQVWRSAAGVYVLESVNLLADETRLLLGKPTPCVGRENDLAALDTLLSAVIEESAPRAVIVTAPAGIGKSRLRHEFLRRVASRDEPVPVQVMLGRGDPMSIGVPFGVIGQLLRKRCSIELGGDAEAGRARLSQHLEQLFKASAAPELSASTGLSIGLTREFLGELAGLPFPDREIPLLRSARQDGQVMGEQLQRALITWLRAECAVAPVLMVLEDLHWSDSMTVKAVELVLRALADEPLCVVATARPEVFERFPKLWSTSAQVLPLHPLGRRACERLVAQVLGPRCTPQKSASIVDNAEGNALFLEELIRCAAEGAEGQRPDTVLALLQGRISRLEAHNRRMLRMASIFGDTFTLPGLRALLRGISESDSARESDNNRDETAARLASLTRAELILEHTAEKRASGAQTRPGEAPEYQFRHALLRDAAYGLLNPDERAQGHRRAAEFLERKGQTEPILLAEHLLRTAEPSAAVPYLVRAAHYATTESSPLESLRLVNLGLAAGAQGIARGELLAVRSSASLFAEDPATAIAAGREAWSLLPPGSRYWYFALNGSAAAAGISGDFSTLLEVMQLFESEEPAGEVAVGFGEAAAVVGSMFSYLGQRERLEQLALRCEKYRDAHQLKDASPRAYAALLNPSFTLNGSFDPHPFTALAIITQAFHYAGVAGQIDLVPIFSAQYCMALMGVGRFQAGYAELHRMILLTRSRRDSWSETLCAYMGLTGLLWTDDPDWMPQLEQLARTVLGNPKAPFIFNGTALGALAHVRLIQGQLTEALQLAREACAQLGGMPAVAASATTTLSRALLQAGDAEAARAAAAPTLQVLASIPAQGWNELPLRVAHIRALAMLGSRYQDELDAETKSAQMGLELRIASAPDSAAREQFLAMPAHAAIETLLDQLTWQTADQTTDQSAGRPGGTLPIPDNIKGGSGS